MKFEPRGPARFQHQRQGLRKMIATGGVTALLFDPGLGKTAVVLDYASLLALKSPTGEARVLVVAPLAAIDTWVMQAEIFVTDQVSLWAEALGGTVIQRAQALAARGGHPLRKSKHLPETPTRGPWNRPQGPRAAWWNLSYATAIRGTDSVASAGPDALGTARPRLVIEVINIDTMASRAQVGSQTMADVLLAAIRRYSPDLVVCDESHRIKGVSAHASMLMARVAKQVRRRVILTGTVMPHSPLDVFAQWRFLAPYAFGDRRANGSVAEATFGGFKERYATVGGWMGREVIGFKNLDHMQEVMALNAVVARKEDALPDLPRTTTVEVPVNLSPAEKQAYQQMADSLAISMPTVSVVAKNFLAQMLRLRQITSGHVPDRMGAMRRVGSSKVDTIRSLAYDNLVGEKRIVVFCFFTEEIEMLRDALQPRRGEPDTEIMVITGETSVEDRTVMRKRFGSDEKTRMILVAQIKTMSLAINELVTASHAIFGSMSQQRDDHVQAQDRLDRIGQTRPVTFWYVMAPGTVDAVIYKSHQQRTNLENALLEHVQKIHEEGVR